MVKEDRQCGIKRRASLRSSRARSESDLPAILYFDTLCRVPLRSKKVSTHSKRLSPMSIADFDYEKHLTIRVGDPGKMLHKPLHVDQGLFGHICKRENVETSHRPTRLLHLAFAQQLCLCLRDLTSNALIS